MLDQITHDPRAAATPSQLRWADEHKARQSRFVRRSLNVPAFTPADKTVRPDSVPAPKQEATPKGPWFWIVCEIDAVGQRPRVDEIILAVCRYYDVARDELISPRRTASIVLPRHVIMYLARKMTLQSLPEIGRRLGDRDHTTILHGIRRITKLRETDSSLSEDIDTIAHALGGVA